MTSGESVKKAVAAIILSPMGNRYLRFNLAAASAICKSTGMRTKKDSNSLILSSSSILSAGAARSSRRVTEEIKSRSPPSSHNSNWSATLLSP